MIASCALAGDATIRVWADETPEVGRGEGAGGLLVIVSFHFSCPVLRLPAGEKEVAREEENACIRNPDLSFPPALTSAD